MVGFASVVGSCGLRLVCEAAEVWSDICGRTRSFWGILWKKPTGMLLLLELRRRAAFAGTPVLQWDGGGGVLVLGGCCLVVCVGCLLVCCLDCVFVVVVLVWRLCVWHW